MTLIILANCYYIPQLRTYPKSLEIPIHLCFMTHATPWNYPLGCTFVLFCRGQFLGEVKSSLSEQPGGGNTCMHHKLTSPSSRDPGNYWPAVRLVAYCKTERLQKAARKFVFCRHMLYRWNDAVHTAIALTQMLLAICFPKNSPGTMDNLDAFCTPLLVVDDERCLEHI